jgi:hypothetical protein
MPDEDHNLQRLTKAELKYLRRGDKLYASNHVYYGNLLSVIATVTVNGWAVNDLSGFRASADVRTKESTEQRVYAKFDGGAYSRTLWANSGWEFWASKATVDRMFTDLCQNKRTAKLRQEAKEDAERKKESDTETSLRQSQKADLLKQVEILNNKIKALD